MAVQVSPAIKTGKEFALFFSTQQWFLSHWNIIQATAQFEMYLPAPNTADQELQLYLTASAKKEKKKFPKINKKQNIPDLQAKKNPM